MVPAAPSTHRPLTVAALLLSMFMSAMEATVVGTAMPSVVADLGGLELYGWVGAAYMLASTVSVPVFGKLADRSGRRPVLLFGIAVFLLGSLASGLATSLPLLVLARGVQGFGAGAMGPITVTVIGDLFTLEERGRVQGLFGAVWAAAGISGPLVGGLIVARFTWPWVFWINLPFGLLAIALLVRFFHEAPAPRAPAPLDRAGAALLTVGALALLCAASREQVALALPLALLCLGAFVAVERRAPDPVLPPALLADRAVAVAVASSALLGATMMGALGYVPLHVQGVLGRSPAEAGVAVTPMLVGWPIAAAITSRLLVRTGFRPPVWLGSALALAGLAGFLAAASSDAPSMVGMQGAMFVYGLGMGLANTALLIGVQSRVDWSRRGVATATIMFARQVGGALGMGALGAGLAASLAGQVDPAALTALLEPRGAQVVVDPATARALGVALLALFAAVVGVAALNAVAVCFYPPQRATARARPLSVSGG
jgi:EmrB/QacA subfamily drug resistance transporter